MSTIKIDDKACRGCSLCVDLCPTKVYAMVDGSDVPKVVKEKDCVECLSCYYVCPATAIEIDNIKFSKEFYRNLDVQEKVKKFLLGREPYISQNLAAEEYGAALRDLIVRMDALGGVYERIMGKSLPSLGRTAGITMGQHIPRTTKAGDVAEAFALFREEAAPAWDVACEAAGSNAFTLTVGKCLVREACKQFNRQMGGNLCVLFGSYITGYIYNLVPRRVQITKVDYGDTCKYDVKVS